MVGPRSPPSAILGITLDPLEGRVPPYKERNRIKRNLVAVVTLCMHYCRNFSEFANQNDNSTLSPGPWAFLRDLNSTVVELTTRQAPQHQLSLSPPPLAVFPPSNSSLLHYQFTRARCTGPPDEPAYNEFDECFVASVAVTTPLGRSY